MHGAARKKGSAGLFAAVFATHHGIVYEPSTILTFFRPI
jgi:hypothetical protein